MSSIAFVTASTVLAQDEVDYIACGGKSLQIPCENVAIQGLVWWVPTSSNGIPTGYRPVIQATKPTTDSVKTVRVLDKTKNITYYIAIADGDDETVFSDACNSCCDNDPVIPPVTIPTPIVEEEPCPVVDDQTLVYEFQFPLPLNPFSLTYKVPIITINGVPQSALNGPYADPAAVLAAVQGAYGSAGTWSLGAGNTLLLLSSETTESASVDIELIPESYCFEIPGTDTTVNGIKLGSPAENVEFPQVVFNDTTADLRNAIVNAIQPYLIGTVEVVEDTGTYYVKYTGLGLPVNLTLDGADVAGTTFATGTCP